MDGEMNAGNRSVVWDSKDNNREGIASGVSLYRTEPYGTGKLVRTRILLLMRWTHSQKSHNFGQIGMSDPPFCMSVG